MRGRGTTIYCQEPKLPSAHPADLLIGLCCPSFAGPFVPDEPFDAVLQKPRSPERPALWGTALPGRHVGLVAVIAVVDLLLMAASFVMPCESNWLLVGRYGRMCGFVDAETGFQVIWPLKSHPLCRSKLMVFDRVT